MGGTYYVQTLEVSFPILLAAAAPGAFSVDILLVNNIRDITTDRKVGKMTLPARIGAEWARRLYVLLMIIAFAVPIVLTGFGYSPWGMLSFAALPAAVRSVKQLYQSEGRELNQVLAGTGQVMTLHGMLLSIGLLVP